MDDVGLLIGEAAGRVLPSLGEEEIRRRLARRGRAVLLRPPRAWCVCVRACDTRINPYHAAIVPEHAVDAKDLEHPGRCLPHTVLLDKRLLSRLCRHVEVEYGTTLKELGRMMGARGRGLHRRRCLGAVETQWIPSARWHRFGNVEPIFSSDRELDPCAKMFTAADPVWSWTARNLGSRIPEGFEQTVERVPVIRGRTSHFEKEHSHPEDPANDVIHRAERCARSQRLPRPPPDYVWYKWKGDVYMGYDWRSPAATAGYMRRQRQLELGRAGRRRRYGKRGSAAGGSLRFWGWAWICPACKKPVKTLYLPVRPINLVDGRLVRSILRGAGDVGEGAGEFYPGTLACTRCHGVENVSRASPGSWNRLVAYLSGGLLYGREVAKPAGFHVRRREYRPQTRRAPARRREQVLRRVLNGWTIEQIARDMEITPGVVWRHLGVIRRQENVRDRHELAKRLGSPHAQPLTQVEEVRRRRERVLELLLEGRTYREIGRSLCVSYSTVRGDADVIYRAHGGGGGQYEARRRLAAKFGRTLPATVGDRRRAEVERRRGAGQSWRAIAREMGLALGTVTAYGSKRRRRTRRRVGALAGE
jgi:DNA-binding NarL/FixJ family response regulator